MTPAEWEDGAKCFGMVLNVPASPELGVDDARDMDLMVINGHDDLVTFTLPEAGGGEWQRLLDTNLPENEVVRFSSGAGYDVTGRSVLLFCAG